MKAPDGSGAEVHTHTHTHTLYMYNVHMHMHNCCLLLQGRDDINHLSVPTIRDTINRILIDQVCDVKSY